MYILSFYLICLALLLLCLYNNSTHVAGTTVGLTYGVSECSLTGNNCELCAVKVLGAGGSGTWTGILDGIEHVVTNCGAGNKCVANMSLGGGFSQSINTAVADAVNAGVTMVVAAGNENEDACFKSPASEPLAITVGSTTSSDARSGFSNYGSCVDVWAPGSGITSACSTGDTAACIKSGTSMARPRKFTFCFVSS